MKAAYLEALPPHII